MSFTQPTIHHILYIESDAIQIAKYGFLCKQPKSMWVELDDEYEREQLDASLARLHRRGRIKLYIVSACNHGEDSTLEEVHDELKDLDCAMILGGTT
jgi:hypothetical protein